MSDIKYLIHHILYVYNCYLPLKEKKKKEKEKKEKGKKEK